MNIEVTFFRKQPRFVSEAGRVSGDDVGSPGSPTLQSQFPGIPTSELSQSKAVRPSNTLVQGCCVESATPDADAMDKQEEQIEGFGEELEDGAIDSGRR